METMRHRCTNFVIRLLSSSCSRFSVILLPGEFNLVGTERDGIMGRALILVMHSLDRSIVLYSIRIVGDRGAEMFGVADYSGPWFSFNGSSCKNEF